jgi:hypothetical protein
MAPRASRITREINVGFDEDLHQAMENAVASNPDLNFTLIIRMATRQWLTQNGYYEPPKIRPVRNSVPPHNIAAE